MKIKFIPACVAGLMFLTAPLLFAGESRQAVSGAYASASVSGKEVVAAAAFAVEARQKAIETESGGGPATLKLVKILGAEEQVVAGMNYRLQMKVKLNGAEKTAEAVVWWQAWRKPDPYRLTSWNWK